MNFKLEKRNNLDHLKLGFKKSLIVIMYVQCTPKTEGYARNFLEERLLD